MAQCKKRTWRKCMRTPQDSEGVRTDQCKASRRTILFRYHWIVICAEHWLGPYLAVILIRGIIAGIPLPTETRAFFVVWTLMNWFIYRRKRRRIFAPRYVDFRLRIQKIHITNSPTQGQTQLQKNYIVSRIKKKERLFTLFSVGYIFTFIHQLRTEGCVLNITNTPVQRQNCQQNATSFVKRKLSEDIYFEVYITYNVHIIYTVSYTHLTLPTKA